MLCEWPNEALPDTPRNSALLSHLLEKLMEYCSEDELSNDVLRESVRMVKELLQQWAARMQEIG